MPQAPIAPASATATAPLAVELCGRLADLAGRVLTVAIPAAGCPADRLLAQVADTCPALAGIIAAGRVRVCLNETIVPGAVLVRPGDAVALFPPVSGG